MYEGALLVTGFLRGALTIRLWGRNSSRISQEGTLGERLGDLARAARARGKI